MAYKAIAAGSVFKVLYPAGENRENQGEFRLKVLTARERSKLKDIEAGKIRMDSTVQMSQGEYVLEACRLGLDGWEPGEVVYTENHAAVRAGRKRPSDAIEFRKEGKYAAQRSLDLLDQECLEFLALQVVMGNTVTSAEKKPLDLVPELHSTGKNSNASTAAFDTATKQESLKDQQDEGEALAV